MAPRGEHTALSEEGAPGRLREDPKASSGCLAKWEEDQFGFIWKYSK